MANEEKLTAKQKRFCEEYLIDWNGVKAYKAVYKSCKSYAAARASASRLLKRANVKAYIDELQKDVQKQVRIRPLMVAKELKKIAFSNPSDLRSGWTELKQWEELTDEQKATIGDVVHSEAQIGYKGVKHILKIRQYDKLKALQMLFKMFGWDKEMS